MLKVERGEPDNGDMRIVIVDDDPAIRALVGLQLEVEGFTVLTAPDGAAGLALVQEQRPDLVVLDVMMPELSGWEVLTLLRADPVDPQVPVVLLTARDMPHDRQRAYEMGASAVLAKPHDGVVLVETVRALLATRGTPRAT